MLMDEDGSMFAVAAEGNCGCCCNCYDTEYLHTGLQHIFNYLNFQSFYSRTNPIHKLMYTLARISCLRYDSDEIPE